MSETVTVVGAGISGMACARALTRAGVPVRVLDRGRRPGGRIATRTVGGRTVDTGASYVTAPDDSRFAAVMADWVDRGLARAWTDTFAVADADGIRSRSTGPMRYAAPAGLRSLVADLGTGLDVTAERTVASVSPGRLDGEPAGEIVLAMPDPQATRLLDADNPLRERLDAVAWEPVIAVVLTWADRRWPADLHGAFVNDSEELSFIADDGDRRGDGAPVLVAHTTAALAAAHLDDPDAAIGAVVASVRRILHINEPQHALAHRWTFARSERARDEPYARDDGLAVCGDGWGGKPSAHTAWSSGDALGRALAAERG